MDSKDNTWKNRLSCSMNGEVLCTMQNIALILEHDSGLHNIVFNDMKKTLDVIGEVPWRKDASGWRSTDFPCLQMYIENKYHVYSPRKCKDALYAVLSSRKRYHPLKDYLNSLQWDGKERLEGILVKYLGAENSPYVRAVTRKTFVAAVARVFCPGIKFDNILVLCGDQGIGKSTLFKRMGKTWYSDSMSIGDMKDKSAAEKLQGVWIMELSELAGIRKVEVETVKSFLSRMDDQYRAPYEVQVSAHPRSSIIVGTTNTTDGFLRDITGNRRFWPVFVSGKNENKAWNITEEEIDQFWAEAYVYFQSGEALYLTKDLEQYARENQRIALETDPRQGLIDNYLSASGKTEICLLELWCDCLGKDRADMKRRDAFELESILRQLGGWSVYQGNTTGKKRLPVYGIQKTFIKSVEGGERAC